MIGNIYIQRHPKDRDMYEIFYEHQGVTGIYAVMFSDHVQDLIGDNDGDLWMAVKAGEKVKIKLVQKDEE